MFESQRDHHSIEIASAFDFEKCSHRLVWPRTSPFHGGNRGSNPLGSTKIKKSPVSTGLFYT